MTYMQVSGVESIFHSIRDQVSGNNLSDNSKGGISGGNLNGPTILFSGLPLIPKQIIPKSLLGRFVAGSRFTSASSVFFRNIIPSSWPRSAYLPKSVSLGGQLGRVTSAVGFYITIIQLTIENWQNSSQEDRHVWGSAVPGAFLPPSKRNFNDEN